MVIGNCIGWQHCWHPLELSTHVIRHFLKHFLWVVCPQLRSPLKFHPSSRQTTQVDRTLRENKKRVIFHSGLPLFGKRLHICFVKANTAISPIYLASDEWKATGTDHAAPKISSGLIIFTLSLMSRVDLVSKHLPANCFCYFNKKDWKETAIRKA